MDFLQSAMKQFRQYKDLAEKGMAQLDDVMLLQAGDDVNNSIIVLIKHMRGNMLSRWTGFLTEDGEKPWRKRDEEFNDEVISREMLFRLWEEGWACVFNALESLKEADLISTIHIRGEAMSAMDGIIRQLTHYAYHVGQIILICKYNAGNGWQSLSIPKGRSAEYNAALLAQASGDSNR